VENECNLEDDREITECRFVDSELLVNFVLSLLGPNCKQPLGGNEKLSRVSEKELPSPPCSLSDVSANRLSAWIRLNMLAGCMKSTDGFPWFSLVLGDTSLMGKKILGDMISHKTSFEGNRKCS